jgi:hypothetical protein
MYSYSFLGIRYSVLLNRTQTKVTDKQAPLSQCKPAIAVYIGGVKVYQNIRKLCPENKCGARYGVVTFINFK